MIKFSQTHKNLLLLLIIGVSFFFITKTLAISNPYSPGATRDPACAAGDANCTVDIEKDLYKENPSGAITNTTSGTNALTIGSSNTASGVAAIAIGSEYDGDPGAIASGDYSVALGHGSVSSGDFSSALGVGAVSSGDYSTALGYLASATGQGASALGVGTIAPSFREVVVGAFPTTYTPVSTTSWNGNDRIFTIGNGTSAVARSNVMTIYKNGIVEFSGGNVSAPAFSGSIITSNITASGSVADADIAFDGTARGIALPSGSSRSRPQVGYGATAGTIRWNNGNDSDVSPRVEYFDGGNWHGLGGGFNLIAEETSGNVIYEAPHIGESAWNSVAIGPNSKTTAAGQIVLGAFPNIDGDSDNIFTIANGTGHGLESNVMVVSSAGLVGLGNFQTGNVEHPLQMASGAHVTSGGVWTDASDRALKDNIEDLEYGLDEILRLRPRSFNYIIDDSESIGFVAQEVEEVIPEVVSGSEGKKGVAYGQLVSVLTNAVQELEARVSELEDELNVTPAEEPEPEDMPEDEVEEEVVMESNLENQQANIIESSNNLNLTNILLIIGIGLMLINVVIMLRRNEIK